MCIKKAPNSKIQSAVVGNGTRNSAIGKDIKKYQKSIEPLTSQGLCLPFCRAPKAECAIAEMSAKKVAISDVLRLI